MNNFKLNTPKFGSIYVTEKDLFEDLASIRKGERKEFTYSPQGGDITFSYENGEYKMYREEESEFRTDEDGHECGQCNVSGIDESYKSIKDVSEALLKYV